MVRNQAVQAAGAAMMRIAWLAFQHYAIELAKGARAECHGACLFFIGALIGFGALVWVAVQ